jgi:hypothetical protein
MRGGVPNVVAEEGTGLARVAARLLRAVLVTTGLVALGWLLTTLLSAGSAAADPTDELTGPTMADAANQVLTATTQTVSAAVLAPPAAADPAPAPPPPAERAVTVVTAEHAPAAAPVAQRPAAEHPRKPARHQAAAQPHRAGHPAPAPKEEAPKPAAAPATTGSAPADRASDQDPVPDRTPITPTAPTSSVSAGHDGPGGARGGSALPSALAEPVPVSAPHLRLDRAGTATSRTAGLPAMSPD